MVKLPTDSCLVGALRIPVGCAWVSSRKGVGNGVRCDAAARRIII